MQIESTATRYASGREPVTLQARRYAGMQAEVMTNAFSAWVFRRSVRTVPYRNSGAITSG